MSHEICQSSQIWPAKFGQILLKTATRLVYCIRKLMRSDIFLTRIVPPNTYAISWTLSPTSGGCILFLSCPSIHLSVTNVCTCNSSYILKENSLKLYVLTYYLTENGILMEHFDQTILECVIALLDIKTCVYCSLFCVQWFEVRGS